MSGERAFDFFAGVSIPDRAVRRSHEAGTMRGGAPALPDQAPGRIH